MHDSLSVGGGTAEPHSKAEQSNVVGVAVPQAFTVAGHPFTFTLLYNLLYNDRHLGLDVDFDLDT